MAAVISAIVGGFIGTTILTGTMMMKGKITMMPPDWDMMSDGVGKKMKEMLGVPEWTAMVVNYLIGSLLIPLGFVLVWLELLNIDIINIYIDVIIYVYIFAFAMILMLGFIGAPKEWRTKIIIGILLRHIIYGEIVAVFVDNAWLD